MRHRMRVTLSDAQYAVLLEEARRSSAGLAELVRQAIERCYGVEPDRMLYGLDESFGSWADRTWDGASYVEALRGGVDAACSR